ncbi:hypothetical protein K440DRAFT_614771 [Wilcoxina mikolae CBS 423.85]|nr:hypothetical protein K440DRAFT_614771 [Wilcoxina mikolae CBS 423.85]
MSETPARRVSSLPTKDPSTSSHLSSTLNDASSVDSQNLSLPTSSTARAVSNPGPLPPGPVAHTRRLAAGGFLLDSSGSRKSSLDRTDRSLYHQSSVGSGRVGEQNVGGGAEADGDPAAMVDLVLSESQKRKGETSSLGRQKSSRGNTLSLPPSRHQGTGRLPSSAGQGRKHLASSPPPAPRRATFLSPLLSPRPFGGDFQQQMRRWSQPPEQLWELQREYKFSEATQQRTLKAKQALELSAAFKELLEIEATRAKNLATLQTPQGFPEKFCEYNPLRLIRNRRLRNRKKIQLDVSPWEDTGAVMQWIEDVAVSIRSPGGEGAGGLPHPPPGKGRKPKRPKMDWIIEPEEMFADYYWMRCEEYKRGEVEKDIKRRKRQSVQSMDSIGDKQRMSVEVSPNGLDYVVSDDNLKKRASKEFQRARRAKEYRRFPRDNDEGFESTATSSEEEGQSDSDYLDDSSASDDHHNTGDALPESESPKHHHRRRKLKRMIKAKRLGGKKLKQHELELEEKRRKQEAEVMDWIASEDEEIHPIPVPHDQPEYRKSFEVVDEEYESATTGRSPIKPVGKTTTGLSFTTAFGGSEGSLDRTDAGVAGLGIIGSADRSEFVIPSIAISLSPPRMPSQEPEERDEDKKESKISPTKKLLGIRKDANTKEKDHVEDSGRDSLDIDRPYKKPNEKEKSSKIGKVKSRVNKLRSEVSKVEELIPWKRDNGSSMPSPTASNTTVSDDEERNIRIVSREGTLSASEFEDLESSKSKLGKQIPELRKPRPPKHRSHYSTSQLGLHERLGKSFDSDREASPERRGSKLKVAVSGIGRERSPARGVKIESLRRKPESHLVLGHIKALEHPSQVFSDAHEEPVKRSPSLKPHTPTISKRDFHHAHATIISAGIIARQITAKTPTTFNPVLRQINAKTRALNSVLETYHNEQNTFVTSTAPHYHSRINKVNIHISQTLTPLVRTVADEADGLSTMVTTEMTLNVKKLQEEIYRLARRRRGRGKMRMVIRILSVTIEWSVRVVLWVIWCVVLAMKITKKIVELVVRVVRWVFWL